MANVLRRYGVPALHRLRRHACHEISNSARALVSRPHLLLLVETHGAPLPRVFAMDVFSVGTNETNYAGSVSRCMKIVGRSSSWFEYILSLKPLIRKPRDR